MLTIKKIFLAIFMPTMLFSQLLANNTFSVTPATEISINTVIFDVGDVLFETSSKSKALMLAPVLLYNPTTMYTLASQGLKKELFKFLQTVPAQTDSEMTMYNQNNQMPQIMVDWMTLPHCSLDVCNKALKQLEASNYSQNMKTLLARIITFMFTPEQLVEAQNPITTMHKLAYALKQQGYKIYILSNWSQDSFPLLQEKNIDLFNLFDGIMISGDEGIGKPNPEFYTRLLQKYNLDACQCVFIDDEPHNIIAAQNLKIHSILRDSNKSVCTGLKELGILQNINT